MRAITRPVVFTLTSRSVHGKNKELVDNDFRCPWRRHLREGKAGRAKELLSDVVMAKTGTPIRVFGRATVPRSL